MIEINDETEALIEENSKLREANRLLRDDAKRVLSMVDDAKALVVKANLERDTALTGNPGMDLMVWLDGIRSVAIRGGYWGMKDKTPEQIKLGRSARIKVGRVTSALMDFGTSCASTYSILLEQKRKSDEADAKAAAKEARAAAKAAKRRK